MKLIVIIRGFQRFMHKSVKKYTAIEADVLSVPTLQNVKQNNIL